MNHGLSIIYIVKDRPASSKHTTFKFSILIERPVIGSFPVKWAYIFQVSPESIYIPIMATEIIRFSNGYCCAADIFCLSDKFIKQLEGRIHYDDVIEIIFRIF